MGPSDGFSSTLIEGLSIAMGKKKGHSVVSMYLGSLAQTQDQLWTIFGAKPE